MRAAATLTLLLAALALAAAPPRPAAHAVPRATLTPQPPTSTPQRADSEPPVWPTEVGAYPAPAAAPAGDGVTAPMLCGVDWWLETPDGRPLPCPGTAPTPEPTPEPAYPVRVWLPLVGR